MRLSQKLAIQQALLQAKKAIKQGKIAEAVEIYTLILQQQPNHLFAKKKLRGLKKKFPNNQAVQVEAKNISQDQVNTLVKIYQSGQMIKTEQACKELLQTYPQSLFVMNVLGVVLSGQDKLKESIQVFDKVIQLKPDYAEAYYNRGVALKDFGLRDKAIESYDKAIQFKPDLAEAYLNRGVALKELGRLDEALQNYNKAIQLKSGYPDAYLGLGDIYLEQGLLEKGLRMHRRGDHVICFDPNNGVSILQGN